MDQRPPPHGNDFCGFSPRPNQKISLSRLHLKWTFTSHRPTPGEGHQKRKTHQKKAKRQKYFGLPPLDRPSPDLCGPMPDWLNWLPATDHHPGLSDCAGLPGQEEFLPLSWFEAPCRDLRLACHLAVWTAGVVAVAA